MGETDRKPEGNKIRIDSRLIIAVGVLSLAAVIMAVILLPNARTTISEYRKAKAANETAKTSLVIAQEENARLTSELEELKAMSTEIPELQSQAYELASQLEQNILDGKSDRKICYLTLDDGPYNRGKDWLELLDKYDIKATFFLTTANGNKLPDQADVTASSMYPEYLKYGHTIGNHTYSHNYSEGGIYKSANAFMSSVEKQEEFTENATGGYKTTIVRFPGGTSTAGDNKEAIQDALREEGYGWVDWTVDSGDSSGADNVSSDKIVSTVKKAAESQDIMVILCHEWSQASLDAMPEIIEYLEGEGYIFLPLFYDSVVVQK